MFELEPLFLALALIVGLLVLPPARRLQLGGVPARVIGAYVVVLWLLGMAIAWRPIFSRYLIPFLLVLYLAPFVAGPDRIERFIRRGGVRRGDPPRPPMKDVTPPSERIDHP